jgi:uncharacterized protein
MSHVTGDFTLEIIYIALLTIIASLVGTMTGFGTSTIMIPALVFFLPPVQAIFLVAIIHWFGNLWKIAFFRSGLELTLILLFGVTGVITSYLGATLTLAADPDTVLRVLGGFLAGYSIFLVFQDKFRVPASRGAALVGGSLSGLFAGLFGMGGAIRAAFLALFDLPPATYIATLGVIGLIVDSTRIAAFFAQGAELPEPLAYGLLIFIPASFAGARGGKAIVEKIPRDKFRLVVALFLFLAGARLAIGL